MAYIFLPDGIFLRKKFKPVKGVRGHQESSNIQKVYLENISSANKTAHFFIRRCKGSVAEIRTTEARRNGKTFLFALSRRDERSSFYRDAPVE